MHPVDLDFFQPVGFLIGGNVRLSGEFKPLRLCIFKVSHHKHVVSKSQVVRAISCLVTQFDAQALFPFQVIMSVSIAPS